MNGNVLLDTQSVRIITLAEELYSQKDLNVGQIFCNAHPTNIFLL